MHWITTLLNERLFASASVMSFETLMSVAGLSNIVCISVGGWLVMQGVMSLGMLFAACNYFSSLSNSFSNITDYFVTMRSTGEVIDRLQEQRNVPYTPDSELALPDAPAISYQNITFSFGERTLYHDFNQQFNPQGCYAVSGGERQRINIARVMCRRPSIIFLTSLLPVLIRKMSGLLMSLSSGTRT